MGQAATKPDGRRQRSQTSRDKIITACLELCEQGVLVSTAQEAADQAGVSLRTVFRLFNDMESLYVEMNRLLQRRFAPYLQGDKSGDLQTRVKGLVAARARLYEESGPYMRSTLSQLWRYQTLEDNYRRTIKDLRRDLEEWLPELTTIDDASRSAIDGLIAFENWDRLRRYDNRSAKDCETVLGNSILKLLA